MRLILGVAAVLSLLCVSNAVARTRCAPGLVCKQDNPDVMGVCVASTCIPFFTAGCTQTTDCCQPCGVGVIAPCAVCIQGSCVGAP
jgi:hypothetical protein